MTTFGFSTALFPPSLKKKEHSRIEKGTEKGAKDR